MGQAAAGWYPHPGRAGWELFWTGSSWSDAARPSPSQAAPVPSPVPFDAAARLGRSGGRVWAGVAMTVALAVFGLAQVALSAYLLGFFEPWWQYSIGPLVAFMALSAQVVLFALVSPLVVYGQGRAGRLVEEVRREYSSVWARAGRVELSVAIADSAVWGMVGRFLLIPPRPPSARVVLVASEGRLRLVGTGLSRELAPHLPRSSGLRGVNTLRLDDGAGGVTVRLVEYGNDPASLAARRVDAELLYCLRSALSGFRAP